MKHNPREVQEGLKELLALEGAPKDYLGARWIIRAAIETIATMQADLRLYDEIHLAGTTEVTVAGPVIEELTADRDRWRKIALWNLEMAGYENPEEHVQLCYYEDGTYHGGAR